MASPRVHRLQFGDFVADIESGELFRNGVRVPLQEKPSQLLALFLQRPKELISRQEIIERVWTDTFIEGNVCLNVAIRRLRAALNDHPSNASFIETVGSHGYRFIADVDRSHTTEEVVAKREHPRLAVSLFRSTHNPHCDSFATLLTELITVELRRVQPSLSVVTPEFLGIPSRKAHRRLPLTRNASADYLLVGTVSESCGQVQVIARLLKFRTQTCVWAESYSEPRDDIFAKRAVLSRKIAEAIIQSIPISLRPSHLETVPANIYETYLQGCSLRSRLSEEALANCIPVFESAVKESPQFAMAWAALANAHCIQTRLGTVPPSSALPRAKYYAYNALAIEDLAEARTALAYYQFLYEHAWDAAETSFLRALALDPKYPLALGGYAQLLAALGRHEEAVLLLHQACELDPFASYSALMFGWALYYARKYEPALVQLKKGLELAPSSWVGHTSAGMAYERLGLLEEALSEFRLAQVYSGDSALAKGHVAYGLARMGDKAGAREILCTLLALREERYFSPYWIALIHLALDQIDEALRWLECAVKERCTWIVFAREDPKFSRLHSDPRFQHLLSGVCPTWDVVIPA